jgi:carbonic anhydrase
MLTIFPAHETRFIPEIKAMFLEYETFLDFDLCFQDFEIELQSLPGDYAPPSGRLFMAQWESQPAGCIALRKRSEETCEMKRLWVRPEFRGFAIGRALAERLVSEAGKIGYKTLVLDTVPKLKTAIALYHSMGFVEAQPYYDTPIDCTVFMQLDLTERE